MPKVASHNDVRAAQLYDYLQDELRAYSPSVEVSETALCNLMGAFISGLADNDRDAQLIIQRIGSRIGEAYEKCKQINRKRRDQEREIIKLDSH